jgi:hypothetical protein
VATGPGGPPDELDVGDTTNRIRERPYHIASEREKIRGRLAQILVWAVVLATAGALVLLAIGRVTVQDLPAVAGVASPLAGIAGAAIGFYFGGDEVRRS